VSDAKFEAYGWRSFNENVTGLLAEQWMLITPGVPGRWNTMTASWGGFGHLWDMDVAFVFVRPSRHSYGFMEKEEGFTLSFFDEKHRKALDICGSKSGRNTDKAKEAGITPVNSPGGSVYFAEARLVIECRKIYFQDINPGNFLDTSIAGNYPKKDYHRMYIGEVTACYLNK
jgi:flavin reductase (DIM6/NTAB) family NADH-FMN oxidoreductase RutF